MNPSGSITTSRHGLFTQSQFAYGGDYNCEQWPEEVWHEDVRLMREAGVNFVSLAIFAWAKVNPAPGVFDIAWLLRAMDLLHENGIAVCLATATASPPAWLMRLHPDVAAVDANGLPFHHGSRQNYSPNSPHYRKYAGELVQALARECGHHPALAIWHINNEYGCHISDSHGAHDTAAFQEWLQRRYSTLAALNAAWYTAFWGQIYGAWEEIPTARKVPSFQNPCHALDFRRFMSDSLRECYRMGLFPSLDQFSWANDIDVAALDHYPDPTPGVDSFPGNPLAYDLTRSLIPDHPFLLMEQVSSQVNWRPVNKLKAPGIMRLWSYQAIARGSDGIMFFQWRQSNSGAEAYHGALIGNTPPAESRVFREVAELGAELKRLAPVCGSLVRARAAIVFSWEILWAIESPAKPRQFRYEEILQSYYTFFCRHNIAVDLVPPSADLSRYAFVAAPQAYLLDTAEAENLRAFVERGGHLLATFFSGVVDKNTHFGDGPHPVLLRDLLGITVEEWQPYHDTEKNSLLLNDGTRFASGYFCESIRLAGAESLGVFESDFFAGQPALTRHACGRGFAYYLATQPEREFFDGPFAKIVAGAGVRPVMKAPSGVEVHLREKSDARYLFVLNHLAHPVELDDPLLTGQDLISGSRLDGSLNLLPNGVAVISQPAAAIA